MYVVYAAGWALLLYATFLINHFDLFGLRQVWLQLVGKPYHAAQLQDAVAVSPGAASDLRRLAA